MGAAKGTRPPNAGKGRVKGVPNKVTAELKDMILGALSEAGGQEYLKRQAEENPTGFMGLLGKVLPKDIHLGKGLKLEVSLVGVDRSARDRVPPARSSR